MDVIRHITRRPVVALALAALPVALAACTAGSSQPGGGAAASTVRIGVLVAETGDDASNGTAAARGARLAADLVDGTDPSIPLPLVGAGGLPGAHGAKLVLVTADSGSDEGRAATQAARLAASPVAGMVATGSASVVAAASQLTEGARVPFVASGPPADFLTERGLDWFFRVGPTDRALAAAGFSALHQQDPAVRQVAILHTGDLTSNPAAEGISELAGESGFTTTASVAVVPGGPPPLDQVRQVRASRPEAVFVFASSLADAKRILAAFGRVGYQPPHVIGLGPGFTDASVGATAAASGLPLVRSVTWSAAVAERNPTAHAVMERYQQRFGAPMDEAAAGAFTAVLTLAQAVDSAGSADRQRIRTALLGLDIAGNDSIMPWDGVAFEPSQQNGQAGAVVEQLAPGTPRVVFPPELAA